MKSTQVKSHSMVKEKALPLTSGIKQGHMLSVLLKHSNGSTSKSSQARKKNKGIQIGKEKIKLSLFVDNVTLYRKSKRYTKKPIITKQTNSPMLQDIKLTHKNQLRLYMNNKQPQNKLIISFTKASKRIKNRNKLNQGDETFVH